MRLQKGFLLRAGELLIMDIIPGLTFAFVSYGGVYLALRTATNGGSTAEFWQYILTSIFAGVVALLFALKRTSLGKVLLSGGRSSRVLFAGMTLLSAFLMFFYIKNRP